jgi:hypothetical protein
MTTEWTDDKENILSAVKNNCVVLQKIHKKKHLELGHTLKYFRLPVIVMSAFNSVLSVGLQPYIEQQAISVTTCLISLIVGIIGSIELYLGIQSRMELEITLSKDYYILSINIFKILTLKRENRNIDADSFLDNVYADYQNLIKKSNLMKKKIDDNLLLPIQITGGTFLQMPETPSCNESESV